MTVKEKLNVKSNPEVLFWYGKFNRGFWPVARDWERRLCFAPYLVKENI